MIEPTAIIDVRIARSLPDERSETPSQGFDLALAAAGLERQAAAALEVHGAAPEGAFTSNPGASDARSANSRSPEASSRATAASNGNMAPAPQRQSPPRAAPRQGDAAGLNSAAQAAAPPPATNTGLSPASAAPAAALARPAPTAPAASAQPASPARQTAPGADVAGRPAKTDAGGAAARGRETAASEQDFARLLARRLADATAFDLRLDPPALGRVEGRMVVGDDGKMILCLTFDTAAGFDFFRDDAPALRAALEDAGFDLAGGDIAFSLKDERQDPHPQPSHAAHREGIGDAVAPEADILPSRAAWGGVDIRI